jgi:hypothetical protein
MDIQEIADRLEISDVLARYASGLDGHDPKLLATVFTGEAVLAYDDLPPTPVKQFGKRSKNLNRFVVTQHIVTNIAIELDGDRARSTSYAHAMHVGDAPAEPTNPYARFGESYLMGGTYTDEWQRTAQGWRISYRRFVCTWAQTDLDVMSPLKDE